MNVEIEVDDFSPGSKDGMRQLVGHIMDRNNLQYDLDRIKEYDTSYFVENVGRFRVNILKQKGEYGAVLRVIPRKIRPGRTSLRMEAALLFLVSLRGVRLRRTTKQSQADGIASPSTSLGIAMTVNLLLFTYLINFQNLFNRP